MANEYLHQTQQDVYDAEQYVMDVHERAWLDDDHSHPIAGMTLELPRETPLQNMEAVTRYVNIAQVNPKVRKLSEKPLPVIDVKPSKYVNRSHARRGEKSATIFITDTVRFRREMVVVHELAHVVSDSSGHGKRFRSVYEDLLGILMGPEIQLLFRMTLHRIESDRD